jgi:hypothetical protein
MKHASVLAYLNLDSLRRYSLGPFTRLIVAFGVLAFVDPVISPEGHVRS